MRSREEEKVGRIAKLEGNLRHTNFVGGGLGYALDSSVAGGMMSR